VEYQKRDRRYGGLSATPLNGAAKSADENLIEALRSS
jgi:hypothetical protein